MAETKILVTTEPFDIGEETARIREGSPDMGAIVTFTGVVRNVNDGSNVTAMTLEHYPGMTQKSLAKIVETARGVEYGDYVCVTFHPSKSKSSNIYTAIKVQDA